MFNVSIELPETVAVATGETGKSVTIDIQAIAKAHPQLLRFAVVNGFLGAMNNVSRGKDEAGAANSDAVWHSLREKRAAVWMSGEWAGKGGGGERATTGLKDAFVAERMAAGATSAQVEASIKGAVKQAFGDKEPATFSRFMDALALTLAQRDHSGKGKPTDETVADYRSRIEAKYRKLADEAAAARAQAKAGLDLTAIDL